MDMIWDQDVRTVLAAIISREPGRKLGPGGEEIQDTEDDERLKKNVQLAIRYADELGKARAVLEKRTPVQYRPQRHR
jgi:hypothetical protein